MRIIDADALWKAFTSADKDDIFGIEDIEQMIESAPTIDLVRCAECKRVREDGGHANCNGYLYCRKWKTLVDEDCYCSWGERSE